MKKYFNLLPILIILFIFIINISEKENKKIAKKVFDENNFNIYSFYKEEYKDRYSNYKNNNLLLHNKDIVLRVNIGLDHSFYTETKEVKDFNILMLVNKYNYVSKDFIPNNLVKVSQFAKDNMYLNEECMNAFIKMASDANNEGYNIRAISTYRTLDYQEKLYNNYVKKDGIEKADTYSARPGFSEHHTGLAIDVDNIKSSYMEFENTPEFNWMLENAHKYGFILRYKKDNSITGYIYEPWHFRYVGSYVSNYIYEKDITFEEYYYEFLNK